MRDFYRIGLLSVCLAAPAQELERRIGNYRISTSYEFGSRSAFVSGNREAYRSAVNYNNGLRLFDGSLRLNSRDGQGRFLDELIVTNIGAGGDPYQANSLRLEKHRVYRLDMGFRIVNYYNQLLALSGGEHRYNTERIFQNYDLTLFPLRKVEVLVGFDRNNQNGPALSSENIDVRGEPAFPRDRFFVFADDVRRVNNQWRAGANVTAGRLKLSFLQGWDYFKEDMRHFLDTTRQDVKRGLVPRTLRRDDPIHGGTPFSRLSVHSDLSRWFAVNGRLVYAGGNRNFVLDENISALNPASGVVVTRQAFVLGRGQRSQGTGDLTLSFHPGEQWVFSNTTSINQTRITGDSAFVELRSPSNLLDPDRNEYFFSLLGLRLITNATDVNFRPSKILGFYGGYHYSIRRVQSREILEDVSGAPTGVPLDSFQNIAHSGLAGIRFRPLPPLTLLFDTEQGRANRPFSPISEKNFHSETLRAQWKAGSWVLGGNFKIYRNRNTPPVLSALEGAGPSGHINKSRQYSAVLGWTPPRRYTFSASYSLLRLDTASGILNFPLASGTAVPMRRSLYESHLHHAHGVLRVTLRNSAVLFFGYSLVKDTAIGRPPARTTGFANSYPNFVFDGTDLINVYPFNYQSPQVKLSLPLGKRVSWNLGWQYYGYSEQFTGSQNYFAHIATASLRWSF